MLTAYLVLARCYSARVWWVFKIHSLLVDKIFEPQNSSRSKECCKVVYKNNINESLSSGSNNIRIQIRFNLEFRSGFNLSTRLVYFYF